ncbi:hypothetical protein M434DRAFT_18246 [Hypoxylon sp. CO27-5]|nr:hypothetical protein M434DRAFT_18246 [Hypoxylon sp. CO27-5]
MSQAQHQLQLHQQQQEPMFARERAWEAKLEDIDGFVKRSLTREPLQVVYLRSAHASGKSTTLLVHIMRAFRKASQGGIPQNIPRLIYVLPRHAELTFVVDYLTEMADDLLVLISFEDFDRPEFPFAICTYEEFISNIHTIPNLAVTTTIMADVELRASVAGEIFFGQLKELIQGEDTPIHNVLLMSPHCSKRTTQAFENVVGRVQDIVVPDINPEPDIRYLSTDNQRDRILRAVNCVLNHDAECKIVISTSRPIYIRRIESTNPMYIFASNLGLLKGTINEARVLVLDPEVGISAPMPNLRLLLSEGVSEAVLFDTLTSQLVQRKRMLTKQEFDQEWSWALKTTDHKTVSILTCLTKAKLNHVNSTGDPWGPAWNLHLPWLTLRIFSVWSDRATWELPIRSPPDHFAFEETIRRLTVMGLLIKGDGENPYGYQLTNLGYGVLSTMDAIPIFRENLHAAYLVAVVKDGKQSTKVDRVLLRMAAISAYGIRNFCAIEEGTNPTVSQIRDRCEGIGRKLCEKGGLWTALGIYLKGVEDNEFISGDEMMYRDWQCLNIGIGRQVVALVFSLEQSFNVPQAINLTEATMLNNDEVVAVERALMWAWVYRVVNIKCQSFDTFDMSSLRDVFVDEDIELLDVHGTRMKPENRELGTFFAIYNGLEQTNGPNGEKKIQAFDLTFIPQHRYEDVGERFGLEWPSAIITAYPPH